MARGKPLRRRQRDRVVGMGSREAVRPLLAKLLKVRQMTACEHGSRTFHDAQSTPTATVRTRSALYRISDKADRRLPTVSRTAGVGFEPAASRLSAQRSGKGLGERGSPSMRRKPSPSSGGGGIEPTGRLHAKRFRTPRSTIRQPAGAHWTRQVRRLRPTRRIASDRGHLALKFSGGESARRNHRPFSVWGFSRQCWLR